MIFKGLFVIIYILKYNKNYFNLLKYYGMCLRMINQFISNNLCNRCRLNVKVFLGLNLNKKIIANNIPSSKRVKMSKKTESYHDHSTTDLPIIEWAPKLSYLYNSNAMDTDQELEVENILLLLFPDNKNIIDYYLTESFYKYPPDQQLLLKNLFNSIHKRIINLSDQDTINLLKAEVQSVINDVVNSNMCFTGQKNNLSKLIDPVSIMCVTNTIFESNLNKMVIKVISDLEDKMLGFINDTIFFNAFDHQSAHQIEPIRFWLDQRFNIYSGLYAEDTYNGNSEFTNELVASAFKYATASETLTVNYFVQKIESMIANEPSLISDFVLYLNELFKKDYFSNDHHISHKINTELEHIVMHTNFKPSSDALIQLTGDKYVPSKQLIYYLLLHKPFPQTNSTNLSTPTSNSDRSFCLRHGVPSDLVKNAHVFF